MWSRRGAAIRLPKKSITVKPLAIGAGEAAKLPAPRHVPRYHVANTDRNFDSQNASLSAAFGLHKRAFLTDERSKSWGELLLLPVQAPLRRRLSGLTVETAGTGDGLLASGAS